MVVVDIREVIVEPVEDGVVVSLQGPGSDEDTALATHRAEALPVDEREVLVPALPRELVEDLHRCHVLVVRGDSSERLELEEVDVRAVADPEAPVAVRARLRSPIPVRPVRFPTITSDQLRDALSRTRGDLGRALDELGLTTAQRSELVRVALRRLRGEVRDGPVGPVRPVFIDLDEFALSICDFVPWCHVVDPRPGGLLPPEP